MTDIGKIQTNIVKVRYYSETTGEFSAREYTYYSEEPLKVCDIVTVPVRDAAAKAMVSEVDIAETEIAAFKDKVKTIPAGSLTVEKPHTTEELSQVEIEAIAKAIKERRKFTESNNNAPYLPDAHDDSRPETAIALQPGEDIEVRDYFNEAVKLLDYAKTRVIKTIEDAKSATNDLSIISRLTKAMDAKRKEKLAPHEEQVKAIRATYNFLMTPIIEAERITKEKQLVFIHEQEHIQREQEEINRKRIEAAQAEMKLKGELTESINLMEVQEAPAKIQTDFGSSGLVDHWKVEVIDMSLLSNEYKIPDMVMLNAIAKKYHDAKKILGVRFFNEPYLATRNRV